MKNVLVTGANRGLGLEFVRQLAAGAFPETVNVIAACRDPTKATALEQIKSSSKVKVHLLKLDVSNESEVNGLQTAVKGVLGAGQGLTLLINNAGYGPTLSLEETTAAEMQSLFAVNSIAPVMITKNLLPLLRLSAEQNSKVEMGCKRAAVVSISSILGAFSKPLPTGPGSERHKGYKAYGASKAALNLYMRGLSQDAAEFGVLVLLMYPGWVETDMGGSMATLSPKDSVSGMLSVMSSRKKEHNGGFFNYEGLALDW